MDMTAVRGLHTFNLQALITDNLSILVILLPLINCCKTSYSNDSKLIRFRND